MSIPDLTLHGALAVAAYVAVGALCWSFFCVAGGWLARRLFR